MKEALKRLVKRSRWLVIASFALRNRWVQLSRLTGAHHQSRDKPPEESADYVESAFEGMLRHGGIDRSEVRGKRILELGPGDNLGLALRFVAAGATQVVTLDKFELKRDPELEQEIYRVLLDRLPAEERASGEAAVRFGERTTFDEERLHPVTGIGVEEAVSILEPESFDLIVSVAVLEHVYDPDASFAAMDRLLKPGGALLHQVDFRDHKMFSGGGHHPLTFLTVPRRTWRAMTYNWGGPNRKLIDYYEAKVSELGYEGRFLVEQVLGVEGDVPARDALAEGVDVSPEQRELIAEIRPRLQPEFRALSDQELTAAGVFMVARKPSGRRTDYSLSPSRSSSAP